MTLAVNWGVNQPIKQTNMSGLRQIRRRLRTTCWYELTFFTTPPLHRISLHFWSLIWIKTICHIWWCLRQRKSLGKSLLLVFHIYLRIKSFKTALCKTHAIISSIRTIIHPWDPVLSDYKWISAMPQAEKWCGLGFNIPFIVSEDELM